MGNSKGLIGSVLIGAGLFLSWAWTLPSYQAASALKELVAEKEMAFQKKQETIEKIKGWKNEYDSRAEEMSRFSSIVPKKKSVEELIIVLEQLANSNGFHLSALGIAEQVNKSGTYDSVDFTMTMEGFYLSVPLILSQLEKSLRLIDVNSSEMSVVESEVANTLSIKLKVSAYVLKEKPIVNNSSGTRQTDE